MNAIKESSKIFAKFAKEENRLSEKFSRKYPDYKNWGDSLFVKQKEQLITILGIDTPLRED
jgi:hypothetical protein